MRTPPSIEKEKPNIADARDLPKGNSGGFSLYNNGATHNLGETGAADRIHTVATVPTAPSQANQRKVCRELFPEVLQKPVREICTQALPAFCVSCIYYFAPSFHSEYPTNAAWPHVPKNPASNAIFLRCTDLICMRSQQSKNLYHRVREGMRHARQILSPLWFALFKASAVQHHQAFRRQRSRGEGSI